MIRQDTHGDPVAPPRRNRPEPECRFPWKTRGAGTFFGQRVFPQAAATRRKTSQPSTGKRLPPSATWAGVGPSDLVQSPEQLAKILRWKRFRAAPWACLLRRLGTATALPGGLAVLRNTPGWPPSVRRALERIPNSFVTDWSFAADSSLWLYHHVRQSRYATLAECGCGLTTILIGLALRDRGPDAPPARHYCLEHDPHWLEQTTRLLLRLGLQSFVQPVHAPLVRTAAVGGELMTYDLTAAPSDAIDFLLIDGPPHQVGRADVVRRIRPRLSPGALVVLDDAARPSERQCCETWAGKGYLKMHGFLPLGHGLALLTASDSAVRPRVFS